MTEFDDDLRTALGRQEPPAGFAARVLKRVDAETSPPERSRPHVIRWAVAATLVAAMAGSAQYSSAQRAREERARGEAAAAQVLEALRIAGSKLQVVQEKVKEIGS